MQEIIKETQDRMQKSIEVLKTDLAKVRTGRANPGLLDHIKVPAYGSDSPLNQVASVAVEGGRTLLITPWDKTLVSAIEKAIMSSDLGLNPNTAGQSIRVSMPALTEERRKEFVKHVRDDVEAARVAIRNIRRDANQSIKDLLKDKIISEDDNRRAETEIQKLTDKFIAEADKTLAAKESELMEI
jgi:ribosome recycling factor